MPSSYSISSIEAYIEQALSDWHVPGAAAAVIDQGEVISCRGYGERRLNSGEPVSAHTLFAIGSCSKAMTAAAIGALVDRDTMGWDDRVIQHLPDFKLYDPWITEHITIRDLLSHRTGLGRAIRLLYRDSSFDPADVIRRMQYLQPSSGFRAGFGYNNPHFIAAAAAAEAASGRSWEEMIRQFLLEPLGMKNSCASLQHLQQSGQSGTAASPHANLDGGFIPEELRALDPVQPIPWSDIGENPAGSIISTLEDMTVWLQMLLNRGQHKGQRILSPETVTEMTTPQMLIRPGESGMEPMFALGLETNILSYGMGWFVMDYRGTRMVFHPGQIHGFVAAVAFLPEKQIGGVILMNTYQTMLHPMLGFYLFDILQGIERDYSGEMLSMFKQWRHGAEREINGMLGSRPAEAQLPFPPEKLAGRYESPLYGIVEIGVESEKPVADYGNSGFFKADLEPWQGSTCVIRYRNKLQPDEFLTWFGEQEHPEGFVIDGVDSFKRL